VVPDGTRRVGAGDDERSHLLHPHILLCDMYIALGVHVVCMHMRLVFGARMHTCMCLHVYINPSICACEHVTSWLLCSGPVSVQCCGACSCRSPGGDHLTTCFLVHPRPVLPLDPTSLHSSSRVRHTCIAAAYLSLPLRQQRPRRTGSVTHRVPAQHPHQHLVLYRLRPHISTRIALLPNQTSVRHRQSPLSCLFRKRCLSFLAFQKPLSNNVIRPCAHSHINCILQRAR
jgi:hypothetical protein